MILGFLASHNGSNMQAILDACADGKIVATPVVIISNNADSYSLERGRKAGLSTYHINTKTEGSEEKVDSAILAALKKHNVDLVILAGYMKKIGPKVLAEYGGRIVNIHPALLPKYGGQGMYGERVHEAVLKAGDKESGVTVHLIDEEYDQGKILSQQKVEVKTDDTVETLAARVLAVEHKLYSDTIAKIADGSIKIPQR